MVDQSLGGCNTVIEPKTRRRYKKHNFVSLELSSKAELFIHQRFADKRALENQNRNLSHYSLS